MLVSIDTTFSSKADPSMKYAKKMGKIMLDANQLAEDITYGIKTKQLEINRPKWIHPRVENVSNCA